MELIRLTNEKISTILSLYTNNRLSTGIFFDWRNKPACAGIQLEDCADVWEDDNACPQSTEDILPENK